MQLLSLVERYVTSQESLATSLGRLTEIVTLAVEQELNPPIKVDPADFTVEPMTVPPAPEWLATATEMVAATLQPAPPAEQPQVTPPAQQAASQEVPQATVSNTWDPLTEPLQAKYSAKKAELIRVELTKRGVAFGSSWPGKRLHEALLASLNAPAQQPPAQQPPAQQPPAQQPPAQQPPAQQPVVSPQPPAYTGTNCSACGLPQFNTPGGVTCANGHGGAPPATVQQPPAQQPPVQGGPVTLDALKDAARTVAEANGGGPVAGPMIIARLTKDLGTQFPSLSALPADKYEAAMLVLQDIQANGLQGGNGNGTQHP